MLRVFACLLVWLFAGIAAGLVFGYVWLGCDCDLGVVSVIVSGLVCCLIVRLLAATLDLLEGYLVLIRCGCLRVG